MNIKKYRSNYYATIILIIFIIVIYVLKNLNIISNDIKMIAYLMVFYVNLLILIYTFASAKALKNLLYHNLYGENAKAKVGFLIDTIKDITNSKKNKIVAFLFLVITIILEIIFLYLKASSLNIYNFINIVLDVITVLSLSNTFVQLHINYTIYRYLSEK